MNYCLFLNIFLKIFSPIITNKEATTVNNIATTAKNHVKRAKPKKLIVAGMKKQATNSNDMVAINTIRQIFNGLLILASTNNWINPVAKTSIVAISGGEKFKCVTMFKKFIDNKLKDTVIPPGIGNS